MSAERLTPEEAIRRLEITPDYDPGGGVGPTDCVHSFRSFLGAHWELPEVEALINRQGGADWDREAMLDHCIVVTDSTGPIRFEAKPEFIV